jgi:hypothetical protein
MNGGQYGVAGWSRFDGYPDSGEEKRRELTVLTMWQELGHDPAEAEDSGTEECSLLLKYTAASIIKDCKHKSHPLCP